MGSVGSSVSGIMDDTVHHAVHIVTGLMTRQGQDD